MAMLQSGLWYPPTQAPKIKKDDSRLTRMGRWPKNGTIGFGSNPDWRPVPSGKGSEWSSLVWKHPSVSPEVSGDLHCLVSYFRGIKQELGSFTTMNSKAQVENAKMTVLKLPSAIIIIIIIIVHRSRIDFSIHTGQYIHIVHF